MRISGFDTGRYQAMRAQPPTNWVGDAFAASGAARNAPAGPAFKPWQEAERDNILAALRHANGRVRGPGGAAYLLGIHPSTLDSRMKSRGLCHLFSAKPGK